MLIFDTEANGFLQDATTTHCLVTMDPVVGRYDRHNDVGTQPSIDVGLAKLNDADVVVGHNVLKYDFPMLEKVRGFKLKPTVKVIDTLIMARLAFPELGAIDDRMIKQCKLPGKYRGSHKLEAWGYRLGVLKGEYTGYFKEWTQDLEDYNEQDVRANHALLLRLQREQVSEEAMEIEHAVTRIIARQEQNGFHFDEQAAYKLLAVLSKERLALEDELKAQFGWWWGKDGVAFTPKKDSDKTGYVAGAPHTKIKKVYFNPGSRPHIARILVREFGWKPTSHTAAGAPEISEESLKAIHHPQAKTLLRFLMVQKRIGQLSDGKEALLKHVRNGKIHGSVNVIGTVPGRMAHAHPNMSQVPATYSEFGPEFRGLFHARPGWALVGADADALELRVFAHFMAIYDGGAYIKTILEGDKKLGTDMHSVNARAIGLDPLKVYRAGETGRDIAKRWFYAMLYGAGFAKLGLIITGVNKKQRNVKIGRESKEALIATIPAMGKLLKTISETGSKRGYLIGLDGRKLHVRSAHSAPNLLFQSAGAVVMKKALVILDNELQSKGLIPNDDYEFCGNFHDEWQIECRPELADAIGASCAAAIRAAGVHFKFRCPLDGQYVVGRTWADTH